MSKYGFSAEATAEALSLPSPKQKREKPATELVVEAVKAGEGLGFVSREPRAEATASRRGGRRKSEPQDKLLIAGPARVIADFRAYCERENIPSYWAALEILMKR